MIYLYNAFKYSNTPSPCRIAEGHAIGAAFTLNAESAVAMSYAS